MHPACSASTACRSTRRRTRGPSSSEPACRAVVAARLNAPALEQRLLRRLRVRRMNGGLLDDPALIAAAATDVGLDPDAARALVRLAGRGGRAAGRHRALTRARRRPPGRSTTSSAGRRSERRYTAPSYEFSAGGRTFSAARLQPGRGLRGGDRQPRPDAAAARRSPSASTELLRAFDEPLATAEVAAIMGRDVAHRARPRRAADPGRRGLLLEALKHPLRQVRPRRASSACRRCARARAARSPRPSPTATSASDEQAPVQRHTRARQHERQHEQHAPSRRAGTGGSGRSCSSGTRRARRCRAMATATGIATVRMVAAASSSEWCSR